MTKSQLTQSTQCNEMPYVAVGTDQRGSACWLVVDNGSTVEFACGKEAFVALKEIIQGGDLRRQLEPILNFYLSVNIVK